MSSKQDLKGQILKIDLEIDKLNEVIGRLRNLKIELKDKIANGLFCCGCGCDLTDFSEYYQNEGYCDDCL